MQFIFQSVLYKPISIPFPQVSLLNVSWCLFVLHTLCTILHNIISYIIFVLSLNLYFCVCDYYFLVWGI